MVNANTCQESVSHPRCSWTRNFWSSGEVSELEDAGSCSGEGSQESDSILQPEHDGSFSS